MAKDSKPRTWKVGKRGVRLTSIPRGDGSLVGLLRDKEGWSIVIGADELMAAAKLLQSYNAGNTIFAANWDDGLGPISVGIDEETLK